MLLMLQWIKYLISLEVAKVKVKSPSHVVIAAGDGFRLF